VVIPFVAIDNAGKEDPTPGSVTIPFTSTLPVTLISFNGTVSGSQALLSWKTANEQSLKQFEAEWSSDGTHWQVITIVAARGGVTGSADYSAVHLLASGINYYRLKMVDIDGRFSYSNTLRIKKDGQYELLVYPNPAGEMITLGLPAATEAMIKIYSNTGATVYTGKANGNIISINIGKLSPGLYTVEVNQGSVSFTERIVKK
jgi:hypothetical protein